MTENTTQTKPEDTQMPVGPGGRSAVPCSTLDAAISMIHHQEYLINRQEEMMQAMMRRNRELVAAANEFQRENHKLRKELEGYKEGRLWTMISSMLPTMQMKFRDE